MSEFFLILFFVLSFIFVTYWMFRITDNIYVWCDRNLYSEEGKSPLWEKFFKEKNS